MKKNSNDNTEASVKENFSNWTGALTCLRQRQEQVNGSYTGEWALTEAKI